MAERTKHIHAQRSFRFLAERHKTLANGTLAKQLIGETNGHQTYPTLSTKLLPRVPSLSRISCSTPATPILGDPRVSGQLGREKR